MGCGSKIEIKNGQEILLKCSTFFFSIGEIKIKTTLWFPFTTVRMAKIQKVSPNKCRQGCKDRITHIHHSWDCRLVQPFWKSLWGMLSMLNLGLPYDLVILVLGTYPKGLDILLRRYVLSHVDGHSIHNRQGMKTT